MYIYLYKYFFFLLIYYCYNCKYCQLEEDFNLFAHTKLPLIEQMKTAESFGTPTVTIPQAGKSSLSC